MSRLHLLGQQLGGAAAVVAVTLIAGQAEGQQAVARRYDLPSQPLGKALRAIALASKTSVIVASNLVEGKTALALSGQFTPMAAVSELLRGSGLRPVVVDGAIVIRPIDTANDQGAVDPPSEPDVTVTGTRIRGAPVASAVISATREDALNAGQATLGELVRSIPQSFGGGQNPGVGTNVPASSGVDIGGGSSVNLRGLGSDATLTLLNGHRVSYSASRQSVDISAIPLLAIDRIEIVADGSSALYGSDAVAGVANVILRRDLRGVETSARVGASTDGGNFVQQYDALAGTGWSSGNAVLAYEYGSNDAIEARQRSYAATQSPGLTLYPALTHHSAILNAHQSLGGASLDLDTLYNNRTTSTNYPLNFAGDLSVSSGHSYGRAQSFEITPTVRVPLGGTWRANLTGSVGHDHVDFAADLFFAGVKTPGGAGYYRNVATSVEANADGDLFDLPGGPAKLALGAGHRAIDFAVFKGSTSFQNTAHSQIDTYGFAELSLPLVTPERDRPFLYRLSLNAALRYESYDGIGQVATPKVGLILAPSPDIDIKASWGRSFRAPTLLQQFNPPSVSLVRATSVGGPAAPATVLLVQGGNPNLEPERAGTWSVTLDLHPRAIPGFALVTSYFSTHYRDRIVTPIGATAVALSNPIYAGQVTLSPSDAAKASLIASAAAFVNASGAAYNPATVVAIVDNSNVNAGKQTLRGVDLLISYKADLGPKAGALSGSLDGAYLDSDQQLTAAQPVIPLAGTVFNPPHFRARGGLTWAIGPAALTSTLNYTGPVDDRRFTPVVQLRAVTTADFSVRLKPSSSSGLMRGIDVSLTMLNAFNAKPSNIRTTLYTDTPYDSTNYSPIGRFGSLSVTKKW